MPFFSKEAKQAIEDLFETTARLVGHPLSLRLDQGELQQVIEAMDAPMRETVSTT